MSVIPTLCATIQTAHMSVAVTLDIKEMGETAQVSISPKKTKVMLRFEPHFGILSV